MAEGGNKKQWLSVAIVLSIMLVPSLGVFLWLDKPWKKPTSNRPTPPPVLGVDSLPAFRFIAQNGDTITRDSVDSAIVVADFFYTSCPGMCRELSASMEHVQNYVKNHQDGFSSKIRLLSHSVDPVTDSVPVLKKYAMEHHADDRMWWLLTGKMEEIYNIGEKFYKVPVLQNENASGQQEQFIHTERLVLLDKKGYVRGYYDGRDSLQVNKLLSDMLSLDINYAIQQGIDDKKVTRGKK